MSAAAPAYAGPLRRFGAMLYDALLVAALLMMATLPFVPMSGDRALNPQESGAIAYLYWIWLLAVLAAFFGYFWTRKGRTLGMQAWRLRIETVDGALPTWSDALKRVAMACAPVAAASISLSVADRFLHIDLTAAIAVLLGAPLVSYLSAYFDPQRRALHERFLRTRIVRALERESVRA